jgi:hypothetical protein
VIQTLFEQGPIEGQARLPGPHLRVGAVIGLGAVIVALGYFGSRPVPPPGPSPVASNVAIDAPSVAASAPGTLPTLDPNSYGSVSGLTPVEPLASQLLQSELPPQVNGRSLAAIGLDLYYVVQGSLVETSRIGSTTDPRILASASRCEAINQLAAAGDTLAWVVTSPAGPSAAVDACGSPAVMTWTIWLLDLNGGKPHQVARGTRAAVSMDVAEYPTHLALSDSAYAFDRPTDAKAPSAGTTVEMHELGGKLVRSIQSQGTVDSVMLGGTRLAVLTADGTGSSATRSLWVADIARSELTEVAQPASSASISPDGSWVLWDLLPFTSTAAGVQRSAVRIESIDSGRMLSLNTLTGSDIAAPLQPSISLTRAGPAIAWFATTPGGAVYPAFRFAGGGDGGILSSVQLPFWLDVQGSSLIWVARGRDGWFTTAFEVDLLALATG